MMDATLRLRSGRRLSTLRVNHGEGGASRWELWKSDLSLRSMFSSWGVLLCCVIGVYFQLVHQPF